MNRSWGSCLLIEYQNSKNWSQNHVNLRMILYSYMLQSIKTCIRLVAYDRLMLHNMSGYTPWPCSFMIILACIGMHLCDLNFAFLTCYRHMLHNNACISCLLSIILSVMSLLYAPGPFMLFSMSRHQVLKDKVTLSVKNSIFLNLESRTFELELLN